eukprot:PhM_4_TR11388/c2_g2_i1/m.31379
MSTPISTSLLIRSLTPSNFGSAFASASRSTTLSQFDATKAKTTLEELTPCTSTTATVEAYTLLADPTRQLHFKTREAIGAAHSAALDNLNLSSRMGGIEDPMRRIQIHQMALSTKFWQDYMAPDKRPLEALHSMSTYYNAHMRRDAAIQDALHKTLKLKKVEVPKPKRGEAPPPLPQAESEADAETQRVMEVILHLERYLWGNRRLDATGSNKYFVGGLTLHEVFTTQEDLRKMELPIITQHSNYTLIREENNTAGSVFYDVKLKANDEATTGLLVPSMRCESTMTSTQHIMREMKPQEPLSWGEWFRLRVLTAWQYWLMFWLAFWCVDEEVITLASLLISKYIANRNMKRDLEEQGGGRLYVTMSGMGTKTTAERKKNFLDTSESFSGEGMMDSLGGSNKTVAMATGAFMQNPAHIVRAPGEADVVVPVPGQKSPTKAEKDAAAAASVAAAEVKADTATTTNTSSSEQPPEKVAA